MRHLLGLYSPMKLELMSCLLVLALALSLACGGSRDVLITSKDVPTATPSPMSTDGPIWAVERLNGKPVIRGTLLTLVTSEDGAWGRDGCNWFSGSHEDGSLVARPDGTISFPGFGQTLVGCGRRREQQGESYQDALGDGREYQVLDSRLEIRDGSGKLRLVMVNKSPLVGEAADLTGTAWRLTSSDGKAPRGMPPTLAFWDEAFVGGTVADYGFVAQYDKWRTGYRIRSLAVTGAGIKWPTDIPDREVRDILQDIGGWDRHAVRDEDGIRLLRVRTGSGSPVDFQELMPAMNQISDAKWRLRSFIEVRWHEFRAGGPPCVENALPGSDIVARFTATTVRGTVDGREYSRDNLSLSMVRPGESSTAGLAGLDPFSNDLPDGRCPREGGEEAIERDTTGASPTLSGTSAQAAALHDIR